ncbi:rhodanese-like domain-containing protein [Jatrophihabitans endophyticus]|uniref:rhodanese-like domain-containing protein n=1 Tax=Jatrophihabitans endophyticus TaxID=1206085 RepID=UPI0019F5802F|nr:rhodanese-like domain-containing protein [Jatrophihabitans endophyticus]MBE7187353.1 sulfurtransferase [Jatrophihabitans endophyticus]
MSAQFSSVDELLADARSRLDRIDIDELDAVLAGGARIVDIRPAWLREREGEISGALVIERNHLEWRLHPGSDARHADAAPGRQWVVVCSEGYTSSLAADALNSLGVPARDLVGGFQAWLASGRPVSTSVTEHDQQVP